MTKRRGKWCASRLYIFHCFDSEQYCIYMTDAEHDHHLLNNGCCSSKFSEEMLQEIYGLVKLHVSPKNILGHLKDLRDERKKFENENLPTLNQLNYIISKHQKEKEPDIIRLGN